MICKGWCPTRCTISSNNGQCGGVKCIGRSIIEWYCTSQRELSHFYHSHLPIIYFFTNINLCFNAFCNRNLVLNRCEMIASKLVYSPNSKYNLTLCLISRLASYPGMSLSPNQYQDFPKQNNWQCVAWRTVSCWPEATAWLKVDSEVKSEWDVKWAVMWHIKLRKCIFSK